MISSKLSNENAFYTFGYKQFGPFLYGFTEWLRKKLYTKKYSKVFFFSRDGFMMKQAFDILDERKTTSEYVYFSRKSLRQGLLWRTEKFEDSLQFLGWERYVSTGKLFEYFGFDENERCEIGNKQGWDLNRDIAFDNIKSDREMVEFYSLYKEDIKRKSKEQFTYLKQYIDQINLFGNCAIVDIGWHGSMQYYLELFLSENNVDAKVDGYYVGIMPNMPLTGNTFGYLYDQKNPSRRKQTLCFFGGYERLFQGFEGSTSGYMIAQDGVVKPILAPYEYRDEQDYALVEHIKDWQKGAIDFIKENKNQKIVNDENLVKPLLDFGCRPSLRDTRLFSGFYTLDGSKRYFTCTKKLSDYGLKEFVHDLSNSQWKTGFLKSAFKIPFPYYLIYAMLRK